MVSILTDLNINNVPICTLCGRAVGADGVVFNGGLYHKVCGKKVVAVAGKDNESDMKEVHLAV